MEEEREKLGQLIEKFQSAKLNFQKLESGTPIQGVIVPGNENVKQFLLRLLRQRTGCTADIISYCATGL